VQVDLLSAETLDKEGLTATPGYGLGIGLDLQAYLAESSGAEWVIGFLDRRERFVLMSYFLLRKTERQIAMLMGMSEFRLNLFLKTTMKKMGALVAFGELSREAWGEILEKRGLRRLKARRVREGRAVRAGEEMREVDAIDCMSLFLGTGSFLSVGETLGVYYVDVRRGLEEIGETLRGDRQPAPMMLGEFIRAMTLFANVKSSGYAGAVGRVRGEMEVTDQPVLGEDAIKLESGVEGILTPRAVGSVGNGGEDGGGEEGEVPGGCSEVSKSGNRLEEGD